jgi:hypothetical protein
MDPGVTMDILAANAKPWRIGMERRDTGNQSIERGERGRLARDLDALIAAARAEMAAGRLAPERA